MSNPQLIFLIIVLIYLAVGGCGWLVYYFSNRRAEKLLRQKQQTADDKHCD